MTNKAIASSQTASEITTYTYNALGQRTKKANQNGLTTIFHYGTNGELLYERDQAGNTKEYVWLNGRPIARVDNSTEIYYYHVDHLGTPQSMTDDTGKRMLTKFAILLIRGYQRWISPYKGYCCAHKAYRGGASCSEYALLSIRVSGRVTRALPRIRARLYECRLAYEEAENSSESDTPSQQDITCRHEPKSSCGTTTANVCTMPCL